VTIESINGKAFDPNDTYAVVTNNFCAVGGDTYYVFKSASDQFDTGIPLDEAVMNYITEELGGVISAEKYSEPRGDLTIITEKEEPEEQKPADAEYYTVVEGDCLWTIAKKYYGTGTKWGVLYELNADEISDPRLIYIGQVIRVK
ncbi:MAG: LysM peptidoglycan-binding domain-containing protein, partial [Oscillospiraceae bacterium]|nr:LysM peptidoglycan-binding domain-containing protein [Oscillospiraceae bacterium]